MSRAWLAAFCLGLLAVSPGPSRAYMEESHYVATYGLALAAGFTPDEAYLIANGAFGPDANATTEASGVIMPLYLFQEAGQLVDEVRRAAVSDVASEEISSDLGRAIDAAFELYEFNEDVVGRLTDPVSELFSLLIADRLQTQAQPLHLLESVHPKNWDLVLNGKPQASENNRKFHCLSFLREAGGRSDDAAAFSRDVSDRSNELRERALQDLRGALGEDQRAAALLATGLSIHYRQDCWSHSGWGKIAKYFGHGTFDYPNDLFAWLHWFAFENRPEPSTVATRVVGIDRDIEAVLADFEKDGQILPTSSREEWTKTVIAIYKSVLKTNYMQAQEGESGADPEVPAMRMMNADHPAVRPDQLRTMLHDTYAQLVEFRGAWSGEGEAFFDAATARSEIDRLSTGLSHRYLLTMFPYDQTRPDCIRTLVGHWIYRNLPAGTPDGVAPRGAYLGMLRRAPAAAADYVNGTLKKKMRSCSDVIGDWLTPEPPPGSMDYLEIPPPRYPALDSEGRPRMRGNGDYQPARPEDDLE